MADTRSSIRSPEATVPIPAEDRDIVCFRDPCLIAALSMAGPMPTRQQVALAQLPFTGSDQHVSAQEPHQRVAQAKVSASLASLDDTLNQFSDAGLLCENTFAASHAYFDTGYFRVLSLFPGHEQRVIDAASGAIAVERLPKRLGGFQLTHIDGVRATKTRSQDVPIHPDGKRRLRAARASSHAWHAGPSSLLRQPQLKSSAPVFSRGAS
ncbi:transcriptional repressor [Mesorhizobium mediterraneum]|uniref:transcriptional repressor n=1 Tax=Mesorhizobium mediterraneum TaxID=43617 RepID=UPI003D7E1B35